MTVVVARSLAPSAEAASRARHALDDLDGSLPAAVHRDLELLVSEVVTNAVRHAGVPMDDSIGLSVDVGTTSVRVEVTDSGPGFEITPTPPSMFQTSGWGLYLVSRLSDRWGVGPTPNGTMVWFEIDLAGTTAAPDEDPDDR